MIILSSAIKNLALDKPTSQSSTAHGGASSRAVDGNIHSRWGDSSCTHTHGGTNQWWRVDLHDAAQVEKVNTLSDKNSSDKKIDGQNFLSEKTYVTKLIFSLFFFNFCLTFELDIGRHIIRLSPS